MQVLKIFIPFLICSIFWGINVECGKNGIKAAGKQHQGEVQAKPAAKIAIIKNEETLKANSKAMKKTGGHVQKQKKHADKKTHELGKGKEAVEKSTSAAESKAVCMKKCMCEKWETNNNSNGQKERTPIRVRAKRANEYCKDCHNMVGDKDEDDERRCHECGVWCGDEDVYSAESTDLNCDDCDTQNIRIRNVDDHYCTRCKEYKSDGKVYEWMETTESLDYNYDDSDSPYDPCYSANTSNYKQQFACFRCSTQHGCNHLSSVIVENNVKCDWVEEVNEQGYLVRECRKFVKYGLDGNELVDSD